jgi:hypothetical protein
MSLIHFLLHLNEPPLLGNAQLILWTTKLGQRKSEVCGPLRPGRAIKCDEYGFEDLLCLACHQLLLDCSSLRWLLRNFLGYVLVIFSRKQVPR